MKKLFLFFALLAGIAVMTGCKKDQDVVTLKAAIDQDTKAYFGNTARTLPYWNAGDKVKVNGTVKTLTLPNNPTTFASIEGVDESNYYAAIFPADAAETMYAPGEDGTTHAVVYFRPDQVYKEVTVGNVTHQKVDMIMGAVANNTTKTLIFENLCSILRLEITNNFVDANNQPCTVKVSRVTVQATGAYVAGSLDATLYSDGNDPDVDSETPSAGAKNILSLYPENNSGYIKTLAPGATATIDVVVPPFNASSLNIELELFDVNNHMLGNSDAIINDPPALDINEIVTLNLNTYVEEEFEGANYAYIEDGPSFYADLHDENNGLLRQLPPNGKLHQIMIGQVQDETTIPNSAVNVKAAHSAYNIWAYLIRDYLDYYILKIDCVVPLIYADVDCSYMFADLPDLKTMVWTNDDGSGPQTGDGSGFQTEDVVDMSFMFANCPQLSSIAGGNFNTTNVRTMAHMFDGCAGFQSDDNFGISNFNTHNLQDMEAMFKGCSGISSLNISNFITKRVYNMSELFSGCIKLKTIHIDRFDMSSVTNKDHMCQNLGTFGQETIKIYCDDPTWTAIQTGTDLSSNTQHLQPTVSK